jgi:ATP-binding cassette subfamily F protein uup
MDELEACLADPECYNEKGLSSIGAELEELRKKYDDSSERYLQLLELEEELEGS